MSASEYDDYRGIAPVPSSMERIIGYNVRTSGGDHVGTIQNLWIDDRSDPLFAGVKTGWIFGKNHVVPIDRAEVNDARRIVRLPFSRDQIQSAPSFDEGADLSDADQQRVFDYYGAERKSQAALPTAEPRRALPQPPPAAVREETMEKPKARTEEERTIRLNEEQLKVGKREVEAGGVRLRKIVRTETVNQPVELKHEEIVIERVPASGEPAAGAVFEGEDIFVPLRREEPVVEKTAHVAEEVRIGKKSDTEHRVVTDQVRREELEVDDQRDRR